MPRMREWFSRLSTKKRDIVLSIIISNMTCKADADKSQRFPSSFEARRDSHHRTGHYSGSAAGGAITRRLAFGDFGCMISASNNSEYVRYLIYHQVSV